MIGLLPALQDVLEFHRMMSEAYPEGSDCKGRPGLRRRGIRLALIRSEVVELHDAVEANDVTEGVDALLDIIYFCLGTLIMWCGVERAARCWDEVHRSNLAKRPPDGTVHVRASDGTVQKPDGWVKPRIAEILAEDARAEDSPLAVVERVDTLLGRAMVSVGMHGEALELCGQWSKDDHGDLLDAWTRSATHLHGQTGDERAASLLVGLAHLRMWHDLTDLDHQPDEDGVVDIRAHQLEPGETPAAKRHRELAAAVLARIIEAA